MSKQPLIKRLLVQIDRFVDNHFPGLVECSLDNAQGMTHIFIEKAPIVTAETIHKNSPYSRPGTIARQILREWQAHDGRHLAQVSAEPPWHVTSTNGESIFVVLLAQVCSPDESLAQ